MSFATALRSTPEQNKRIYLRHEEVSGMNRHQLEKKMHEGDQSVRAQSVSGQHVQSSNCSTEEYDRVSNAGIEEARTTVIAKLVSYIMKQNDHYNS
jgi:hypothetical protein